MACYCSLYAPRTGGAYDSHPRTTGNAGRARRRGGGVAARWACATTPRRPDRRGRAETRACTARRGHPHGPAITFVSQQINVGVAIRYRVGCAIDKFGTVKRNRGPNVVRWKMRARKGTSRLTQRYLNARPMERRCRPAPLFALSASSDPPFGASYSCAPRALHGMPNASTVRQNRGILWLKGMSNA